VGVVDCWGVSVGSLRWKEGRLGRRKQKDRVMGTNRVQGREPGASLREEVIQRAVAAVRAHQEWSPEITRVMRPYTKKQRELVARRREICAPRPVRREGESTQVFSARLLEWKRESREVAKDVDMELRQLEREIAEVRRQLPMPETADAIITAAVGGNLREWAKMCAEVSERLGFDRARVERNERAGGGDLTVDL
jgi:hypothetical protein